MFLTYRISVFEHYLQTSQHCLEEVHKQSEFYPDYFFSIGLKKMYLYKQPLFHEASWLLTLQAQWHQGFPSVFKAMCSGTTTLQTFYVSLLQHTWFPGEDWQDTGLETHDLKLNFVVVWAILLFLYWHVKVDMNDLGQRELKSVIVLWETDMTFRFGDHFA